MFAINLISIFPGDVDMLYPLHGFYNLNSHVHLRVVDMNSYKELKG